VSNNLFITLMFTHFTFAQRAELLRESSCI